MKKQYSKPEIRLVDIKTTRIICTSPPTIPVEEEGEITESSGVW